ncbi:PAS-domain containing protein [Tardiphaga sp.]|jgi:PAS domain-containing protein|uniref:PAS-domain containing protein n=1 Tax=Tardiphaga sp. TaxID=1926292 RepID=UPI0037DA06AC
MQIDWRMFLDPGIETAIIVIAAVGLTLAVRLHRQRRAARLRTAEQHATAERLTAALDRIDIGIVLLNADTRAEFINRAFRDYFALPDAKADSKPPLIALMYHARDTHAYTIPPDEIDHFIARRIEQIRGGNPAPETLRLASGRVLRLSCTVLPDGGRMLSYTPVTDLIRHDDDRANRDYYVALRGSDVFRSRLDAAE